MWVSLHSNIYNSISSLINMLFSEFIVLSIKKLILSLYETEKRHIRSLIIFDREKQELITLEDKEQVAD